MIHAKREQQRQVVREAILEAARDALIRQGYESFSMRKLAGQVGISPGTIYLYFRDKRELLDELVEQAFDKLLERLHEVHDLDDAVRSLENKLRAYVDFGLTYPNHYHFAFVMRRIEDDEDTELEPHAAFDVMRDAVRRCIEEGAFPSAEGETTSQVLWATIHGITSLLIVLPQFPWVERESLVDHLIATAISGLRHGPVVPGAERERDERD